jgi:hypothetical protein
MPAMRRYIFFVLSAVFLFVGGIAAADTAPPANPDLAKLQKMVDNLGYTATLSHDGKFITVQWPSSNYTNPISLQINQTHTLVYAYVDLLSYTQAQLAKLDSNKLLEASDSGDFFFSMEKNQDGKTEELYANTVIPWTDLTPELLRHLLQNMADSIDGNGDVWDSSRWK